MSERLVLAVCLVLLVVQVALVAWMFTDRNKKGPGA